MIVIGKSDNNYIVMLPPNEYSNLINIGNSYDLSNEQKQVGFEYDVDKIYWKLKSLRDNESRFNQIKEHLTNIISSLDKTEPYVLDILAEEKELKINET